MLEDGPLRQNKEFSTLVFSNSIGEFVYKDILLLLQFASPFGLIIIRNWEIIR